MADAGIVTERRTTDDAGPTRAVMTGRWRWVTGLRRGDSEETRRGQHGGTRRRTVGYGSTSQRGRPKPFFRHNDVDSPIALTLTFEIGIRILTLNLDVVDWRLLKEEGGFKLRCLWKLRDFKCEVELINGSSKVAEAANHFPNIHLEQLNQVRAELWIASIIRYRFGGRRVWVGHVGTVTASKASFSSKSVIPVTLCTTKQTERHGCLINQMVNWS
ncbi:hypothetical protein PIB30_044268 [Stylosanthes scabra]|uniref:4a-hydroxytetrahydrobiopterin dehydratase n=1 Tax=Stylosanthes scabra TaxID=79078 RepID=A0ABU6RFZ8_9FABA|nr:hypothetical protein [Stylosanthes scabra]